MHYINICERQIVFAKVLKKSKNPAIAGFLLLCIELWTDGRITIWLSRKKVWIIRFALSLGYSLLMYWINWQFNIAAILSSRFVCKHVHYLIFLLQSCVLYFLVSKSNKKQGSRVRHSVLPLFKSCLATSFSRFTPRRSLLVAMLGVARTRCAQTSCHLLPSIARLLTVPPNAALPPLAGNYLCEEDSLTYIVDFDAYNGNVK